MCRVVCYLYSSKLHHRPDPLRNHVEVLCSLWGNQGKFAGLQRERERQDNMDFANINVFTSNLTFNHTGDPPLNPCCIYVSLPMIEVVVIRYFMKSNQAKKALLCFKHSEVAYYPLLSGQTLSLRMSSAANSASPACWPFWMMGCHSSLGVWSMPGFNFTTGVQTLRPSSSSFPWAGDNMPVIFLRLLLMLLFD